MSPAIFDFNGASVRVVHNESGIWFVASDVCWILGISNTRDAVSGLDDDEKITVANTDGNPRAGIPHQFTAINESGLYSLILRSRKPEAKAFKKWVTSEVLPSIRKTGSYAVQTGIGLLKFQGSSATSRPHWRRPESDSANLRRPPRHRSHPGGR